MDRTDGRGLTVAIVGHLLLFAALTLSIAHRVPPVHAPVEAMDVQLVDAVGLRSAAPERATEAPREMQAPDAGVPIEAPPPAPSTSAPSPARPAPPATPSPAPAANPKPPARPITDILKDVKSKARTEQAGSDEQAKADKAAAARVGTLLKGVIGASAGKGETARATVSGAAMNGLAAAIKRQVQPCYELGGLGGTSAMQIVTTLRLRYNKDGSVAGNPQLVEQTGINAANRAYAQQIADVARRAVLRCSPVHLPAELYEGGWDDLDFRFTPGQMQ
ncbi:MAG TPA: hypothetical protein VNT42_12150 [Sphingomonas sp.]|nr:hypothetical protein [Sphingomonas sp.]